MTPSKTFIALFSIGTVLAQGPAGADSQFSDLLRHKANASERDMNVYSRPGAVFSKILPNPRKGELAAAGAVRIPVTLDFFLDQFRDIEAFKKGRAVLSIGKFGDPPRKQNLGMLTMGKKELDALAKCRPGKCALKLSAELMMRLRNSFVAGGGPALETQFRTVLLDYLSRYRVAGTPAMITYDDTIPPVQTSKEFLETLEQFSWLKENAPRLVDALKSSPASAAAGLDEFFYWSKESYGLKAVVSMTHVLILRTTMEGRRWAFIASKQIYADHYFEASLGLTVLAEEPAASAGRMISMAYFNRSMTDGLRGWFSSIERSIVERRIRSGMKKQLAATRDKLAGAYRDRPPSRAD